MSITTVGLDAAKSDFQVHGVDATRKAEIRRKLRRSELVPFYKFSRPVLWHPMPRRKPSTPSPQCPMAVTKLPRCRGKVSITKCNT